MGECEIGVFHSSLRNLARAFLSYRSSETKMLLQIEAATYEGGGFFLRPFRLPFFIGRCQLTASDLYLSARPSILTGDTQIRANRVKGFQRLKR